MSETTRNGGRKRKREGLLGFFTHADGRSEKRGGASSSSSDAVRGRNQTEELEAEKWSCSVCTLLNSQKRCKCEVCRAPKPQRGEEEGHDTNPELTGSAENRDDTNTDNRAPSKARNAFTFMMVNAAKRPRKEKFVLHRSESNKLSWHWSVLDSQPLHSQTIDKQVSDKAGNASAPTTSINRSMSIAFSCKCALRDTTLTTPGCILLETNIESANPAALSSLRRIDYCHRMTPGQLKSALQKNVRTRRKEEAVMVAAALMRKDFVQFVRRIMIIVLEDSLLHPDYPFLSWLLLATSKGFVPDMLLMEECLRIVWEVASCKWRDSEPIDALLHSKDTNSDAKPVSVNIGTVSVDCMESTPAELVRAILCRARFGGMSGDMKMLSGFARLWIQRFKLDSNSAAADSGTDAEASKNASPTFTGSSSSISSSSTSGQNEHSRLKPPTSLGWLDFIAHAANDGDDRPDSFSAFLERRLRAEDIPLSAIDFHCVPQIMDSLMSRKECGRDVSHSLKSAMWYFSSSRNTKKLVSTGKSRAEGGEERARLLSLWAAFQRQTVEFQRQFIQSKF